MGTHQGNPRQVSRHDSHVSAAGRPRWNRGMACIVELTRGNVCRGAWCWKGPARGIRLAEDRSLGARGSRLADELEVATCKVSLHLTARFTTISCEQVATFATECNERQHAGNLSALKNFTAFRRDSPAQLRNRRLQVRALRGVFSCGLASRQGEPASGHVAQASGLCQTTIGFSSGSTGCVGSIISQAIVAMTIAAAARRNTVFHSFLSARLPANHV
jgi:hypothetical protein